MGFGGFTSGPRIALGIGLAPVILSLESIILLQKWYPTVVGKHQTIKLR